MLATSLPAESRDNAQLGSRGEQKYCRVVLGLGLTGLLGWVRETHLLFCMQLAFPQDQPLIQE